MVELTPVESDPNSQLEPAVGFSLLAPGSLFHSAYEVVRCLGAGGMGAIYEVLQSSTRRRRVLKTLLPRLLADSDMRARFRLEATITAEIESEHIVEVFDAGLDEATGLPFLVMEYLRGENLASLLRQKGPFNPRDVVLILHQASLALERTHARGVVHRDLKPENLFLISRDDGSPRLKILDFGIAKIVAESKELNTTRSFGTPLYMSPEQIRGDGTIDGRADLYSLGQLTYTLLVGHAYWEREVAESSGLYALLLKVVEGSKDSAGSRAALAGVTLPREFDEWFRRATHPLPEERFDTALSLADALADALGQPSLLLRRQGIGRELATGPSGDSRATQAGSTPTGQPSVTLAGVCDTGPQDSMGHIRPTRVSRSRQLRLRVLAGSLVGLAILVVASEWGGWVRSPGGAARAASTPLVGADSIPTGTSASAFQSAPRVASEPPLEERAAVKAEPLAPHADQAPAQGGAPKNPSRALGQTIRVPKSERRVLRAVTTPSDPSDVR